MNIFFLDKDPRKAAIYQADKHVVKMILESAQMLCTCIRTKYHQLMTENDDTVLYKKTHINHPCNVWLRGNPKHVMWLLKHAYALCDEYTLRYQGKVHKTRSVLDHIRQFIDTHHNEIFKEDIMFYAPPLAMPDDYKIRMAASIQNCLSMTVQAYRKYYFHEKYSRGINKYSYPRKVPLWIQTATKEKRLKDLQNAYETYKSINQKLNDEFYTIKNLERYEIYCINDTNSMPRTFGKFPIKKLEGVINNANV